MPLFSRPAVFAVLPALLLTGCSREAWYGPPREAAPSALDVPPRMLPNQAEGMALLQRRAGYPDACRQAGVEGRVFVRFVVDEFGNPIEPEVVRGIHYACDQAAVDAVLRVAFAPGTRNGIPVPVAFSLPVTFRMR